MKQFDIFLEAIHLMKAQDNFKLECFEVLMEKARQGYHGWDNPKWKAYFEKNIVSQSLPLTQKECINIANFAMFVWYLIEKGELDGIHSGK